MIILKLSIFADVDEDYEKMNSYFETLKIDDFDDFDDYLVVYNILEMLICKEMKP